MFRLQEYINFYTIYLFILDNVNLYEFRCYTKTLRLAIIKGYLPGLPQNW